MSVFSTSVRPQFAFLPPIAWAIAIDALDFLPNVINFFLQFIGGIGIATDLGFDGVQTFLAFLIFQDPLFAVTNADFVLPPGFDVFPAYTAKVVARQMGLVR